MPSVTPDDVDLVMLASDNVFLVAADPDAGGAPSDVLTGKTVTSGADSSTNLQASGSAQLYERDGSTAVGSAVTLTWTATLFSNAGAWAGQIPAAVAVVEGQEYLARVTLTLTTSGRVFKFWRRVKFVRIGES